MRVLVFPQKRPLRIPYAAVCMTNAAEEKRQIPSRKSQHQWSLPCLPELPLSERSAATVLLEAAAAASDVARRPLLPRPDLALRAAVSEQGKTTTHFIQPLLKSKL